MLTVGNEMPTKYPTATPMMAETISLIVSVDLLGKTLQIKIKM